jgi:mRNA interferase MazF
MVNQNKYVPERGDIVWLNFNPQAGHEQAGLRPAVVVSPSVYNGKVGLAIFCPITNQAKGYPFEVVLSYNLKTSGVVLSDQIKCLDWKIRKAQFIEKLPDDIIQDILAKINTLVG